MLLKLMLATGITLVSVGSIPAQELVENPEYASWAKFKKGTSVTMKSTSIVGKMTTEVIVTEKLIEVGPEKLVLESTALEKNKDKDFKREPMKRDVSKTMPLPKGLKKEDLLAGKPPGTSAEGSETLKFGELELKVTWYKYGADVDGTKVEGKRWVSDKVPGNIAKSEMTTTGVFASKLNLDLVEIKKP